MFNNKLRSQFIETYALYETQVPRWIKLDKGRLEREWKETEEKHYCNKPGLVGHDLLSLLISKEKWVNSFRISVWGSRLSSQVRC